MTDRPLIVYPDADGDEETLHGEQFARIREFANLKIYTGRPESKEEYVERVKDAQGILLGWDLPGDVMQQAEHLEVISFSGVGPARFVDMAQAEDRSITVCNCPGYSDITVAEHALALLLALCRHIPLLDRKLRSGVWESDAAAIELHGKTIGLVGFGGIGKRVSELCGAFGMDVLVWTRSMDPALQDKYGVELCALEDIYKRCDIVSLHLACNAETEGIVDQGSFDQMNEGTILINTARAELVVEDALIQALQTGILAGAALDVFHDEPLPATHPLTGMQNVILTPHIGYNTPEAVSRLFEIAADNLVRYFQGNSRNRVI